MNPFLLFSIALTAIFGAWQSTIITSYSLNLLTEPIPPTPFPSTLQLITNITGNLSTSLFVPPYLLCPLINPWNLDIGSDGTGVFPEDRRSVDTLPMTNKGDDDLQGPTSGLEKELEVSHPVLLVRYPAHSTTRSPFVPLQSWGFLPSFLLLIRTAQDSLSSQIKLRNLYAPILLYHSMSLTRHSRRPNWNSHRLPSLMR